jgi:Tfp pilus assembly protein PilF
MYCACLRVPSWDRCSAARIGYSARRRVSQARVKLVSERMEQQKNSGKSWRLVLWGIVVALLSVGALAAWQLRDPADHPPGQVPMLPISTAALKNDVLTLAGVDPGSLLQVLAHDASVKAFADRATAGKTSADARAQAVVAALAERRKQRGFVDWSRVEPRVGLPLSAVETLRAIERDGAERQLYPLEVAALAVAALRSVEVPALLAEVYAFGKEPRPVDPSGRFGYFGVFVPEKAGAQPLRGRVYDAYGGRSQAPADADFAVWNDAQAVGGALALRAMHVLRNDLDIDAAERDSGAALTLVPSSASIHGVRAAVVNTVGHPAAKSGDDGKQQLQEAQKLRDGAAQRNNLALSALTRQDWRGALKELGDTLTEMPEYALAHVTRATALLINFDFAGARAELDLAAQHDPELAFVPQIRAQLLASEGKSDEAVIEARRAVALNPQDAGSLFILARIEHRLGLKDDERKHAKQIVERTPAAAKEERTGQVRALLGPNIFDEAPKSGAAGAAGGHASK